MVLDPERGVSTSGISPPPLGKVQDSCDSEKYKDYDEINIQAACETAHADFNDNEHEVKYRRHVKVSDADRLDGLSNLRRSANAPHRVWQAEAKPRKSPKGDLTGQSLTEHQLLLLNNTTFGFALKTKAWCEYSFSCSHNMLTVFSDGLCGLCIRSGPI